MKRLYQPLFLVCAILFGLEKSTAQGIPAKLETELNKTLKTMRLTVGARSLSAAIQFSDNATWSSADGVSSQSPLDYASPDHSYAIGSITKSITDACVLQLADEGKLTLGDSLHKWLPAFPYVNPNITIRQLLRHQSGLFDVITNPAFDAASKVKLDSIWSLSNLVRDYIKAPLFAPGASWSYSNTNYALLGLIVEAATGNTYHEEYKRRFFDPLNLGSLVIPPYDPYPSKVAHVWLDGNGDGITEDFHFFFSKWRSFSTAAGPIGAYYATAKDVAVWNRAFLRGDLHSPATLDEAKTTVATTMPASGRYGLGIMERKFFGLVAYGHGGDIGYSGITYYFPAKDISITVLNNDGLIRSWDLAPIIQALLKVYLDYQTAVSTTQAYTAETLKAKAYPNPFSDDLTVSAVLPDEAATIAVVLTNAVGATVAQTHAVRLPSGPQNIPIAALGQLPRGVYFANILIDGAMAGTVQVVK